MLVRPCPTCRTPTAWERNPWKPFCSERCRTLDLGAWASERYALPDRPEAEEGEGWSGDGEAWATRPGGPS